MTIKINAFNIRYELLEQIEEFEITGMLHFNRKEVFINLMAHNLNVNKCDIVSELWSLEYVMQFIDIDKSNQDLITINNLGKANLNYFCMFRASRSSKKKAIKEGINVLKFIIGWIFVGFIGSWFIESLCKYLMGK